MAKSNTRSTSKAGEKKSHPVAQLYGHWALNPLVEIAHTISHDFVARPQQYRNVSDDVADILADFRFKLGSDRDWPDAFQRTLSFKVLHQVNLVGPTIRQAALLLRQQQLEGENGKLLDAFRDAASEFRTQIESLEGQALAMSCDQTGAIFNSAVRVLQDPGVAKAFGLPPAPSNDWPLGGNFSGDGAYLIEVMVRGLKQALCLAGAYRRISIMNPKQRPLMPKIYVVLPKEKFITLQKAAYFGGLTISMALAEGSHLGDDKLINSAYKWTKALQKLIPDAPRAWKDLEYRSTLTDLEWGLAPNPSGDAIPLPMVSVANQTFTVHGEVCCCSGDTDCDPTVKLTDFCTEFCTIV